MPRDLRAIFRDLADIDARLNEVASAGGPEGEMNVLADALHNLVDIVRELAERTR